MIQNLIQTLAVSLMENGKTMTFTELRSLLSSVGYDYKTDLGVARGPIRSAYSRATDPEIKDSVPRAYTNKYGLYP